MTNILSCFVLIDADADSFERLPGSLVKTPLGNITLQCYNDIVKTTEDVAKGEAYALAGKYRLQPGP